MKRILTFLLAIVVAFGVFSAGASALSPSTVMNLDLLQMEPPAPYDAATARMIYTIMLGQLSNDTTAFLPGRNQAGWNAAVSGATFDQIVAASRDFFLPHALLYTYQLSRLSFYMFFAPQRLHAAIENAVFRALPSEAAIHRMIAAGQWEQLSVYADGALTAVQVLLVNNNVSVPVFPIERPVPAVRVSSVRIAGAATRNMVVGNTLNLSAAAQPANAANRHITWSSSNRNVATVNANGRVTAVGAGTATITARSADGNRTAAVRITVSNTIFNTRHEANVANWLLFFLGFGWIWMWF